MTDQIPTPVPEPAPRKRPRSLRKDPELRARFVELMKEPTANIRWAAAKVGVSRSHANDVMRTDPQFAAEVEEATDASIGEAEHIAWNRGLYGVVETVKDAAGNVSGRHRVSDQLLALILRSRHPDYRPSLQVDAKVQPVAPVRNIDWTSPEGQKRLAEIRESARLNGEAESRKALQDAIDAVVEESGS